MADPRCVISVDQYSKRVVTHPFVAARARRAVLASVGMRQPDARALKPAHERVHGALAGFRVPNPRATKPVLVTQALRAA
ncbi:MAG: hypothetical protein MUF80_10330, partial [Burkholderiales bacterium]|nr:hypothetical protein [Burkholderiales bacterium]